MITHERLKELLSYDRTTGEFRWLAWRKNSRQAGERAGYSRKDGYVIIVLDNSYYLGHRVAWFYETGSWPADMIDHINGDPADNRMENLREASRSQNMMNMALPPSNTSGIKGVSYIKSSGKWEAYIGIDRRKIALGIFQNKDDAALARRAAEAKHFGEFARSEAS